MDIIQLLQHVGADNIMLQVLRNSATGTKLKKNLVEISFITDQVQSDYLMRDQEMVGFVIWVPKDKLPNLGKGGKS